MSDLDLENRVRKMRLTLTSNDARLKTYYVRGWACRKFAPKRGASGLAQLVAWLDFMDEDVIEEEI